MNNHNYSATEYTQPLITQSCGLMDLLHVFWIDLVESLQLSTFSSHQLWDSMILPSCCFFLNSDLLGNILEKHRADRWGEPFLCTFQTRFSLPLLSFQSLKAVYPFKPEPICSLGKTTNHTPSDTRKVQTFSTFRSPECLLYHLRQSHQGGLWGGFKVWLDWNNNWNFRDSY